VQEQLLKQAARHSVSLLTSKDWGSSGNIMLELSEKRSLSALEAFAAQFKSEFLLQPPDQSLRFQSLTELTLNPGKQLQKLSLSSLQTLKGPQSLYTSHCCRGREQIKFHAWEEGNHEF